MPRLVLIDRDGTLNVERNYLSSPDEIELVPRAAEALKLLRSLGLTIAVVTNQSAIGRGYFDVKKLNEIHERLNEILRRNEAAVDAIYFCPHLPEDGCECRKPLTKMARQAAQDFDADLSKSFVIGDNTVDIGLGKNIAAVTILVRTGYGAKIESAIEEKPDYIVQDIYEAACVIKEILEKETRGAEIK